MQARDLDTYAKATGRFLVDEHGFAFTKRRYIRTDGLLRSAWFMPLNATADKYAFDVVFDLGIPGISEFGPRAQQWVVRAHARQASRVNDDYPDPTFVLSADESGKPAAAGVDEVFRRLVRDFLLRYQDPADFYAMVRDSAVVVARHGMSADNEFNRLRLDPFNVAVRLELAAVYAAYLGLDDDVEELLRLAQEYAIPHRVDYILPRMEAGVEAARRSRTLLKN